MKTKNNHLKAIRRLQAETLIKNFKKRGIDGKYFDTCAEAVEAICRLIPAGSLVGLGGSETITEASMSPGRVTVCLVGETLGY